MQQEDPFRSADPTSRVLPVTPSSIRAPDTSIACISFVAEQTSVGAMALIVYALPFTNLGNGADSSLTGNGYIGPL